jgi:hypothetical protein
MLGAEIAWLDRLLDDLHTKALTWSRESIRKAAERAPK